MKHLAILALSVALLAGCRKDDVIVCEPPAPATFADLRAAAPPIQTFSFDLAQAQSLHTVGGGLVSFPANAFVLPDGSMATGRATLRLRELHSVGDMVLAGLHTNAASLSYNLLVSAGEFNMQFWQGSVRLQWNPAFGTAPADKPTLATPIPSSGISIAPMFLWKLPFAVDGTLPVVLDSTSGWQPAGVQLSPQGQWLPLPTTSGLYTAVLPLDSISWINFDQFWNPTGNPVWTSNYVRVPAGASETRVYFRPAGYTSLSRTFPTSDPTLWGNHFPNGTDIQAIVIQIRDGQFYFGTQHYIWQPGQEMAPALEALSAADVIQRVRQL